MAMMRTRLGLTEKEIMNRPWILTQIESADLPYYSPKKKDVVVVKDKKKANDHLSKYM